MTDVLSGTFIPVLADGYDLTLEQQPYKPDPRYMIYGLIKLGQVTTYTYAGDKNIFKIENAANRKSDSFYVEFMGIPENHSNTLGRQVNNVTLPQLSFTNSLQRERGFTYNNKGDFQFGELGISFYNDVDGKVEAILTLQLLRQLNRTNDLMGVYNELPRKYKFDIKVTQYDQRNTPIRYMVYKQCYITNMTQDTLDMKSSVDRNIDITLVCDDVDIELSSDILSLVMVMPVGNAVS